MLAIPIYRELGVSPKYCTKLTEAIMAIHPVVLEKETAICQSWQKWRSGWPIVVSGIAIPRDPTHMAKNKLVSALRWGNSVMMTQFTDELKNTISLAFLYCSFLLPKSDIYSFDIFVVNQNWPITLTRPIYCVELGCFFSCLISEAALSYDFMACFLWVK